MDTMNPSSIFLPLNSSENRKNESCMIPRPKSQLSKFPVKIYTYIHIYTYTYIFTYTHVDSSLHNMYSKSLININLYIKCTDNFLKQVVIRIHTFTH